jgi:predicted ATPase
MTDGRELPIEVHEHIVSKTDGIPLFVEELTRTVLESGIMAEQDGCFTMAGRLPELAIPATLQDSLMSRLDRLGPSREIAQIGAALGRSFPHQLIAAVAPASPALLRAALDQLAAADLLHRRGEPPDATYIFRHALVQDVAYESLLRSRRTHLHSRIADVLDGQFAQSIESEPETMAHHLARAGRIEEAISYLRKAGERAIRRSANVEAIRHLQRGLELLKQLPESRERQQVQLGIDVVLGQALIAGRGYAAAETRDVLLRAKELLHVLTDPADRFAVLYGIWACYYVGGEVALQQEAASEFLAAAQEANDSAALCIAHRALGTTFVTMGEFATGRWHLEQARALYDPEHHLRFRYQYGQDIGTTALCYLCWALWHLGHTEHAAAVAREAVAYAEKLDHPHTTAYAVCHARGMMDMFRRDPSETVAYTAEVITLCNEHGFPFWAAGAQIMNGWAKCAHGQVEEGIATLEGGLNKWRRTGARLWLPMFLASEAEACAGIGALDRAMDGIEQAIAVATETGERWAMAEVLRIKAALILSADSEAQVEAEKLLLESLDIAKAQQARSWQLRTAVDLAKLWQRQGRSAEAEILLQDIVGQFPANTVFTDLDSARVLLNAVAAEVRPAAAAGMTQARL